jgi:acyl dehydratase
MNWWHPGSKCFEELSIGDRFVTVGRTMTETDIQSYAGLSGDFHVYHTNEVEASGGAFGGRICHGLLSVCVLVGLFRCRLGLFDNIAATSLGLSKLRLSKPVRPGDTIHAELHVADLKDLLGKPDRGLVVMQVKGVNQDDDTFMECEWTESVARRAWRDQYARAG